MICEVNVKPSEIGSVKGIEVGRRKLTALMCNDPDLRVYLEYIAIGAMRQSEAIREVNDRLEIAAATIEKATAEMAALHAEMTSCKKRERAARKLAGFWFQEYVKQLVGHGYSLDNELHG